MCYDGCPYFEPYSERCRRGHMPCPNDFDTAEEYEDAVDSVIGAKEAAEERQRECQMEQ